jgi:UcrQ family
VRRFKRISHVLTRLTFCLTAISPWQTKAGPHWLRNYLFNGYRRISGELVFFGIPFAIGVSRDDF